MERFGRHCWGHARAPHCTIPHLSPCTALGESAALKEGHAGFTQAPKHFLLFKQYARGSTALPCHGSGKVAVPTQLPSWWAMVAYFCTTYARPTGHRQRPIAFWSARVPLGTPVSCLAVDHRQAMAAICRRQQRMAAISR